MPYLTAYEVFGVREDAPVEEISRSWKALMKQHHPDANPGADPRVAQEINRAYDVLKDPAKRHMYDVALQEQRRPRIPAVSWVVVNAGFTGSATTILWGENNWIVYQ